MNLKLAKAETKDLKEISRIYKEEFSKPPYNEQWTFALALKRMKNFLKEYDMWKLVYQNQIVGLTIINTNLWAPKSICFMEEMAVKNEFQNRGFGTFMINKIMKIYKKRGYSVFMAIALKKAKAFKLYKKLGIKESKSLVLIERRFQNGNSKRF